MDIFHCSECDAYILRNIAENRRIECYCGEYMPQLSSEEVLNHLNTNRDKKHEESKRVYVLMRENKTLQSDLDEAQKALESVMDVNDKLRVDLLGLSHAIETANRVFNKYKDQEHCVICTGLKGHRSSCPIFKAEKIIKELELENE